MRTNRMMAGPRLNALIDETIFRRGYTGKDYSGEIGVAWEIVRHFAMTPFSLVRFREGWFANFNMPYDDLLVAQTEALAICYAGLKRGVAEDHLMDPDCKKAHEYRVSLFGFDQKIGTRNLDLWEEIRQGRLRSERGEEYTE